MEYVRYFNFYFSTIAAIIKNFPNADIGINWKQDKEILYEIIIPGLDDCTRLVEILTAKEGTYRFTVANKKTTIKDYLSKLENDKQTTRLNLLNNYFLYDTNFSKDEKIRNFLKGYTGLDSFFSLDPDKSYPYRALFSEIQHCMWNLETILNGEKVAEQNRKDINFNRDFFFEINVNLTYLFINLDGLIKNFKDAGNTEILNLIDNIKIEEYKRYKYGKPTKVTELDALISHYRDAVCHSEMSHVNISKASAENVIHMLLIRQKSDNIIAYGDGRLHFNKELKFFVKKIASLLLAEEIDLISVNDDNGHELFYDLSFINCLFPINNKFRIAKVNEGHFIVLCELL
jgi:hypothetical protein